MNTASENRGASAPLAGNDRPPLERVVEMCELAGLSERRAIMIWLRARSASDVVEAIRNA